jgi:predicted permease
MLSDLRLAVRILGHSKAWTGVVLVSLTLGIGANTALFSAINGLVLKKLPVRDPDSLVRIRYVGPNEVRTDVLSYGFTAPDSRGRVVEPVFSYPMFQQFAASNHTMTDVLAAAPFGRVNVVVNGEAEVASAFVASGNYFEMLGVSARFGRTFTGEDDRASSAAVAVISHKYWMSRFGGATSAVGTSATVNNVPVSIVGVLPPEFTGVEQPVGDPPDVSLPLALEPRFNAGLTAPQALITRPTFWWLYVVGRLKPGVTPAQVEANLGGVFRATAIAGLDSYLASLPPDERARSSTDRSQVPDLVVDSASRGIYDVSTTDRRAITVLTSVVVLVLLVVCANIANLLLSRSVARQKELSVRLALGATRARLAGQFLTESLLLSAIGGTLGLIAGRWCQQLLPGAMGQTAPLDWRVLAFVALVAIATGVVFGIAPAVRATRAPVNAMLKESGRAIAGSRSPLGKALVIAQVAISLALLSGAGLLLRTLQNLRHVDMGFNPRNILLFQVSPALNRYDTARQNPLYEQIRERLHAIPGVRSVSWSNPSLMSNRRFSSTIFIEGRAYARGQRDTISGMAVSPTFFETMEIPLLAGRGFTERDTRGSQEVVVVNEAAARRFFPNESAIGRRLGSSPGSIDASGSREIIGVLRDAKYNSLRDAAVPTMYSPYLQRPQGSATFEIRTTGDPLASIAAVRDAVRQVDPNIPLINVTTQLQEIERRFVQEKVLAQAYAVFGGLALLVAAVGLFGVMSYNVARRTNEIGIRMALGARSHDVLRLVMSESMALVVVGLVIGAGAAIAMSRLIASLLFGLAPTDPLAMAGAMSVMLIVSALAGYLPARHAAQVDPMTVLRDQ